MQRSLGRHVERKGRLSRFCEVLLIYLFIILKKNVLGAHRGGISSPKELTALLPFVWRKKEGPPKRGELGDVSLEGLLRAEL